MRLALTITAWALLATAAQAQGGRTVEEKHVTSWSLDTRGVGHIFEATGQAYQWPGVYFETRFKGRTLEVKITDTGNRYNLYIDQDAPIVIDCHGDRCTPKQAAATVKTQKGGWHTARLEKISESQKEDAVFYGFAAPGGKLAFVPPRARQIEYIGDSWTVGYGNTSPKQECTQDEVDATTDTSQAFGPITAKHFDADYQVNAFSGRGVVRNYDGIAPGEPLPAVYPYVKFDKKTVYTDTSWKPHLIVIGLGGNDFSTPVKPGEKWASEEALGADYEASYVVFLKELRRRNPNAFLLVTDYEGPKVSPHVQAVIAAMKAGGETRIDSVTLGDFTVTGCHWHLDLNDHRRISAQLNRWIESHPDLWSYK